MLISTNDSNHNDIDSIMNKISTILDSDPNLVTLMRDELRIFTTSIKKAMSDIGEGEDVSSSIDDIKEKGAFIITSATQHGNLRYCTSGSPTIH